MKTIMKFLLKIRKNALKFLNLFVRIGKAGAFSILKRTIYE